MRDLAWKSAPAFAVLCMVAGLLVGCGESVDYNRIYDEALAERAAREHAEALDGLPPCTSINATVISTGPCIFEGETPPKATFGGKGAP